MKAPMVIIIGILVIILGFLLIYSQQHVMAPASPSGGYSSSASESGGHGK